MTSLPLSGPPAAGSWPDGSWEGFVGRYSKLLLRVAFDFGPGYDRAMDRYAFMLEELRRNDCRRLRRFTAGGRAKFSTWLVTVARRLCVDEYRRRYGRVRSGAHRQSASGRSERREGLPRSVDLTRVADLKAPDPAERLSRTECSDALRLALESLGHGDRRLVELFFAEDFSAREVAAELGLPGPFHAYRRLRRVLSALRLTLGRDGIRSDAINS